MPMHDWTKVEAGIYHAMHFSWIATLSNALNGGLLPSDFYVLPEQHAETFEPDILTLKKDTTGRNGKGDTSVATLPQTRIKTTFMAESEGDFYRKKRRSLAIRHVSDDSLVAVIEIMSPGNKAGVRPFQAFLDKTWALLQAGIHLLIVDPFPSTKRDPKGVHAAIWEEMTGMSFEPPANKPLTLVSYEVDLTTKAYIEPLAVGDVLPDMPLFLEPRSAIMVPLESTYDSSFSHMPERWRSVLGE